MGLCLHQADKHVTRQVFDINAGALLERVENKLTLACCRPILETRTRRTRRSRTAYAYTQPT
jgi:hypothetical protein